MSPPSSSIPPHRYSSRFRLTLNGEETHWDARLNRTPAPRKCWIRTLDADSLLYIFQLATGDNRVPVALSHVCRQWRDIVLYTPTLWTSIEVWQSLRHDSYHYSHEVLRAWRTLELSEKCAVAVEIYIKTQWPCTCTGTFHSHDDPEGASTHFTVLTQQLSKLLTTHAARIKKLCIVANEPSIVEIQKGLVGVPMPLLVHCCITNDGSNPENSVEQGAKAPVFLLRPNDGGTEDEGINDLYPRLNSLHILSTPFASAQLSQRNLQTLSLAQAAHLLDKPRISASGLREVLLANEHSLWNLKLPNGAPLDLTAPYVMSNMRSLSLSYETPIELVPFLQSMRVPNLKDFSLKDLTRAACYFGSRDHVVYDASIESLVAALIDNLPLHNLTSLHLRWVRFLPDHRHFNENAHQWIPDMHNLPVPDFLFRFMSSMTSLETLSMSDPDYPSLFTLDYHPRLTNASGTNSISSTPVPMLSSLTLEAFNLHLVQKFIAKTATPRALLKELHLKIPRTWRSKLRFNTLLIAEKVVMDDVEFEKESILMEPYE